MVEMRKTLQSFCEEVVYSNECTTDFHTHNKHRRVPVFIYDDMKRSFDKLSILSEHSRYIGRGVTKSNNFLMIGTKTPKWLSCIALKYQTTNHETGKYFDYTKSNKVTQMFTNFGAIYGELWLVEPKRLFELDNINGNDFSMYRQKESIQLVKTGGTQLTSINALMYLGKNKIWEQPSGSNIDTIKMQILKNGKLPNKPFYTFSEKHNEAALEVASAV